MKNMSQQERTEKHRNSHPEDESRRKARQRQKERLLRFHIARNHLYGYGIPESVDQNSDVFKRVREQYLAECVEPVEVRTWMDSKGKLHDPKTVAVRCASCERMIINGQGIRQPQTLEFLCNTCNADKNKGGQS